jgi:hypothetical protein
MYRRSYAPIHEVPSPSRFCFLGRICTVSKIRGDIYTRRPTLFSPAMAVSKICFRVMTPTISRHRTRGAHTLYFVPVCAPRNTGVFHTHGQGCHTGCPEAFWRAYRAGGLVHYALYKPGGVP